MGNKGIGIIIVVIAGIGAAFYFLKGKIMPTEDPITVKVGGKVFVEGKGIVKTVKSPQIKEVKKKEVADVKKGVVFDTAMMRSQPKSERPWRKAGMTHRAWKKVQRTWEREQKALKKAAGKR